MALATLFTCTAKGYTLIDKGIVSHNRCYQLRPHPVVNKNLSPNYCAGMNFNPSQKSSKKEIKRGMKGMPKQACEPAGAIGALADQGSKIKPLASCGQLGHAQR